MPELREKIDYEKISQHWNVFLTDLLVDEELKELDILKMLLLASVVQENWVDVINLSLDAQELEKNES